MFSPQELRLLSVLLTSNRNGENCYDDTPALLDKVQQLLADQQFQGTVYVDIPDKNTLGQDDTAWTNVNHCQSVSEAVAWIREHIGDCDDNGNVSLLTLGEPKEP